MTALLAAIHFVGPLLFFTDLTRNPYFTQIALVNVGLAAAAAMWVARAVPEGRWRWVKTPLDLPWALCLGTAALSWTYSYLAHAAFYRPAMASEGLRAGLFLAVNSAAAYFLAAQRADQDGGEAASARLGGWTAFVLVWGAAWTFFPQLRGAPSGASAIWPHVWDPYGALVWAGGLSAVLYLVRSGGTHDFQHLLLATGFLGAVYGIAQYFAVEFFWPKILNPYGGRSVSTFGNPNFMSSYMLMLLPMAVTYYLHARSRAARLAYAAVFLALEGSLLCSLTRSSWIGGAAALAPLAFSAKLRRLARQDLEFHGLVAAAALAMAALWPQSAVGGYAPSVIGRLSELSQVLTPAKGEVGYSPLHQRFLIWLCAWTMGAENPLTGKGFGMLELFYPFYQGHYLLHIDIVRNMRTHANNAHNEILEVFAQTGILGLGAALLLWTAFFRRTWSSLTSVRDRESDEPVWALAAASGAAGMLVDNLLNVSLHFAVPGLLFWWQAGTAMGLLSRREERVAEVPAPRPKAAAAAALTAAAALLVAWHWTGQWMREALYFGGFKVMRRGDARGASDILERAYKWHSREVNTNYELGNAYARSDRFDKAVWAYKEALNANSGYDEIYFNLGTLESLKLGRREEALDHYRVSWAINPLSEGTAGNYAALLLQRGAPGDAEEAEQALETALRFSPGHVNFTMTLAGVKAKAGRYAGAEGLYAGLLRRQPNFPPAEQALRASLALSRRPAPEVLRQLDDFRRLEGLIGRRDYGDESLRLAKAAAAAFPDATAGWFYLGNLELIHGNAPAAESWLRRVVESDPSNLGAKLNLGQALKRLGRREEAATFFRQVLAADPANAMARAELGAAAPLSNQLRMLPKQ
ncbi:MAG: tetratricopeptide repeat protein [Elusimicrobia bacterium]|nr:tetratricopeptide repeat protein [Elusimicrobiota bacterium]